MTVGDSSDAKEVSSVPGWGGENKTRKMSTETESLISPRQNIKEAANIENEFPPGKSTKMEHMTQVLSETLETPEITANSEEEKTMEQEIENDFDPFAIVENIADLTVEHLKETLLGTSDPETDTTTPSASDQAEEKERKEMLEKLSTLSSEMKTLEEENPKTANAKVSPRKKKRSRLQVVNKEEGVTQSCDLNNIAVETPPSRSRRKESKDDKDGDIEMSPSEDKSSLAKDFIEMMDPKRHKKVEQKEERNSLLSVETENILNDSSSSTDNILNSRATPPSRSKKVKQESKNENKEEIKVSHSGDKSKVSHDFIEMMNPNRTRKMELKEVENILSVQASDSSPPPPDTEVDGKAAPPPSRLRSKKVEAEAESKKSGGTNVSLSESSEGTLRNNYEAKKLSAVNIPTIRTFQSVTIPSQTETNNGQMCRQRQGNFKLKNCQVELIFALICRHQ